MTIIINKMKNAHSDQYYYYYYHHRLPDHHRPSIRQPHMIYLSRGHIINSHRRRHASASIIDERHRHHHHHNPPEHRHRHHRSPNYHRSCVRQHNYQVLVNAGHTCYVRYRGRCTTFFLEAHNRMRSSNPHSTLKN